VPSKYVRELPSQPTKARGASATCPQAHRDASEFHRTVQLVAEMRAAQQVCRRPLWCPRPRRNGSQFSRLLRKLRQPLMGHPHGSAGASDVTEKLSPAFATEGAESMEPVLGILERALGPLARLGDREPLLLKQSEPCPQLGRRVELLDFRARVVERTGDAQKGSLESENPAFAGFSCSRPVSRILSGVTIHLGLRFP
jgi:hypothetical protein